MGELILKEVNTFHPIPKIQKSKPTTIKVLHVLKSHNNLERINFNHF